MNYFSCNQDPSDLKRTQLAWEQDSLRDSIFQIHFTTVSAFCVGVDANCNAQANAKTKTYFLMSFLVLSPLYNQCLYFWTLNVFMLIIFHPNVTYKCCSVTGVLLRGQFFMCRGFSRTQAPAGSQIFPLFLSPCSSTPLLKDLIPISGANSTLLKVMNHSH